MTTHITMHKESYILFYDFTYKNHQIIPILMIRLNERTVSRVYTINYTVYIFILSTRSIYIYLVCHHISQVPVI